MSLINPAANIEGTEPAPLTSSMILSALSQPVHEGARMVALHWVQDLHIALNDWRETVDAGRPEHECADALIGVRAALRGLRATLRNHRRDAALRPGRRVRRALRRAQRQTEEILARGEQRAWLDEEIDRTQPAVIREADELRGYLSRDISHAHALRIDAIQRLLLKTAHRLEARLSHYSVSHTVGEALVFDTLGDVLARRLTQGFATIERDLAAVDGIHAQRLLRRLRAQFAKQVTMLDPFRGYVPHALAWWSVVDDSASSLRTVRDVLRLAGRAHKHGYSVLADSLRVSAVDHYEFFMERWQADLARLTSFHTAAIHELSNARLTPRDATTSLDVDEREPSDHGPTVSHGLPMEIERKFLLHGLPPEAAMAESLSIEQGWLPGTLIRERLRRTIHADGAAQLTRTIKVGTPGARIELEEPVDPALFTVLWPLTVDARIRKRRHLVGDGAIVWEVDVFLDRDLVLAEVELTHVDQLVVIPSWLAPFVVRDVTNEPAYLNSVMAQRDPASTVRTTL